MLRRRSPTFGALRGLSGWEEDSESRGFGVWRQEGDGFVMELALDGYRPDELKIDIDEGALHVRASRERSGPRLCAWQSFAFSSALPPAADDRTVEGTLMGGKLVLRAERRAGTTPRKIPILTSGGGDTPRLSSSSEARAPAWRRAWAATARALGLGVRAAPSAA